MSAIADILQPEHVILSLEANTKSGAVEEVLTHMAGSGAIGDLAVLREAVLARDAAAIAENGTGICIAHGRTETVRRLVLGAGRAPAGFACDDIPDPVRLVFVAGIPGAPNADYLRVVGAIARICRDPAQLQRLLAAKTAKRFVELLAAGEMKL